MRETEQYIPKEAHTSDTKSQPNNLVDIFIGDIPVSDEHRRELEEEAAKIDYESLQFLLLSDISDSQKDIPCPEFLRDLLTRKGGIDGVLAGIKSVIGGMGFDKHGRQGLVEAITGNFEYQEKITHGLSPTPRVCDTDTFGFQLIETIDRLARRFPDQRQACEQLLLDLLNVYDTELHNGVGGYFYEDEELASNPEYTDVPLGYGRAYDNVTAYRVQQILNRLTNHGSQKSVDRLIEFYKNQSAYFIPRVADAMSVIDAPYAVQQLLPLLNENDEFTRKGSAALLYRLELGRIGVSEGVVEYLSKQYELKGAEKKDVDFAHRITADGKIGLFDRNNALIGYFELGDLTNPEKKRHAQILEVSRELLFADPNTDDAIREDFLQNYLDFYNDLFFQETGIRFNNLSLRDQVWFFEFMKQADEKTKARARGVIQKYGEAALSAFISCESGEEMGEAVLTLGEKLPRPAAEAVFGKYAQIAHRAERVASYLTERFGKKQKGNNQEAQMIVQGLLLRGKELLQEAAAASAKSEFTKEESEVLLESLNNVNADVMLFAHTFKVASETHKIELSDIKGASLMTKDSSDLTDAERKAMHAIFTANRASNPKDYPPELLKARKKDFKELLEMPGKKFYIFKDGEEIVAFVHYEDKEDKKGSARYLGSFNVNPSGRGQKIGTAFLQSTLEQEGRNERVILNVNGGNPYLDAYLNKFGFTIQRIDPDYRGSGKPYYFLERQPSARSEEALAEAA